MRFNSPPNWPPSPPGWTPPPDWRPDPSWPPPPPGWQLWVDDTPPSNKKGLIIGGIAAAWWSSSGWCLPSSSFRDTPQVTVTSHDLGANSAADDEDEIKDVVKSYEDAWNDGDFDIRPDRLREDQGRRRVQRERLPHLHVSGTANTTSSSRASTSTGTKRRQRSRTGATAQTTSTSSARTATGSGATSSRSPRIAAT